MKSLLNYNKNKSVNRARHCLALLLILPFILPLWLNAQQDFIYFEKRIDFHNNYDRAKNILPSDSNYVVAGITEDSTHYYHYHLSLSKFDSNGNIVLHKEYGYDSINIIMGNPGSLKFKNGHFYTVGEYWTYTETFRHQYGIFTCYNENLDTLWMKKYGESFSPYDTLFVIDQMEFADNNNFVLVGGRMPEYDPSRIWLLKTDSLGNKLWEHFYGEGDEYFQGHSVVQTADGGYVIGGTKFLIQATGGAVDPLIIKTDSLGNEEWRLNPGNPYVDDNKVMVALAADGNIIAGTNYGTLQNGDNREAKINLLKISIDGNIIWNYTFGETNKNGNFLLNTVVLNNGNIISNGSYTSYFQGDEHPESTSWILCTDSTGNQLWYKEYVLLAGHNSSNELFNVRQTPDGGLIGCGMVHPVLPDTGTTDIWLMKMDSMGCLFPGCDTTVMVEEKDMPGGSFMLFPNPAQNNLTLKLTPEAEKEMLFTVFNMYGIKTKTVTIPLQHKLLRLNISKLPQGVYLGVLTVNGTPVGSKKFIIER